MISAIRCGGKYTYILVSVTIISQMSCQISAFWIKSDLMHPYLKPLPPNISFKSHSNSVKKDFCLKDQSVTDAA